MQIQTIAAPTSTQTPSATARNETDFLQLLVTQMVTQDPLEPMSTDDMMNQLTQLKVIENMEEMREISGWQLRAAMVSLVGKNGKGQATTGEPVSGVIDAVRWMGEEPFVIIGGKEVRILELTEVQPR